MSDSLPEFAEGMPNVERHPADHNPTDVGNAQRLVARHGSDLRFCWPWNRWLVWDDQRWAIDETGEAVRRMKETIAALAADIDEIDDEEQQKVLRRHVLASE